MGLSKMRAGNGSKGFMRFLLTGFLFALVLAKAPAQEIKILDLGGNLFSIDAKTAEMQFIGNAGLTPHFWNAMAMDSQGRMYGAYGRYFAPYAIYEIDPDTGQATFVVQTSFIGIRGMAFGPGDMLYLTDERDAPLIASPVDLHTLDLATGATTLIGELDSARVQCLDFFNGELFGNDSDRGLIKIDTNTALTTDLNPNSWEPQTLTVSFCFSESGALFYVDSSLWMIDPQLGTYSLVHPALFLPLWAEAEFIEGPKDPFALWLGGETDGPMTVHLSGASPNANIAIAWERGGGAAGPTAIPAGFPCEGTMVNLTSGMQLLTMLTTNANGEASTPPQFVPAGARRTVHLQAIDFSTCETSNRILIAY